MKQMCLVVGMVELCAAYLEQIEASILRRDLEAPILVHWRGMRRWGQ